MNLAVVEYGLGNVQSVVNACTRIGAKAAIVRNADELVAQAPERIILPGVGAIERSLEKLVSTGLATALTRLVLAEHVPFLGICVGMQVLAESCEEFGVHRGLGWIDGRVEKLNSCGTNVKVPHVGWNDVAPCFESPLFEGISKPLFYFVHSCAFETGARDADATTIYGRAFPSAVRRGAVLGVQFHPEKSSAVGERLLTNFLSASHDALHRGSGRAGAVSC